MDIKDFLAPADVLVDVRAPDKNRLLADLSRRAAARVGLHEDLVAREILKRETLGSTGTGGGIAIPHARFSEIAKPFGLLARVRKAIAFEAIDGEPVDVVFLLLLPAAAGSEQLNALASVARRLRQPEVVAAIRQAPDAVAAYEALTGTT